MPPKTLWTCWFQGWDRAPDIVRRCLGSWRALNPEWRIRALDAVSVRDYLDLEDHIDLSRQTLTAASLSDVVRLLLLHEFGGVWADATLLCRASLDRWLPAATADAGFFAFAKPAPDRPLSSWFLAAEPGNPLIAKWTERALAYWRGRAAADDYFWLHHAFRDLVAEDEEAAALWARVPKISADGPHSPQSPAGLYSPIKRAHAKIDWSAPVFKLTHRINPALDHPESVLRHVLRLADPAEPPAVAKGAAAPIKFASLKVSTENLGDHIQILAGRRLLSRLDIEPQWDIDRDDEIASAAQLNALDERVGILLNGWFKTNDAEWPPNPKLWPLYIGFHMRLFQSPSLVSPAALEHYRANGPIGARDKATAALLCEHGVDAYVSQCLSILAPRRFSAPVDGETLVVSRDMRLFECVRDRLKDPQPILHYSGSTDFDANMQRAAGLLQRYRARAGLVVTTLLHCALPALAMGAPVIMFHPPNNEHGRQSDRERFSSLADLIPIHDLDNLEAVDWSPQPLDLSAIKLRLLDQFFAMAGRWPLLPRRPIGPIAPSSALPPPP
ncbi:MAG TPA: capsular polysaccharide synthesis protein [Caulobacterales bacterium]|nr:capsular polysaccharide synthesis protein [Caulobacterales bacterium]